MKKQVSVALAALIVSSSALSLAACGSETVKIDETKTQLYVSNYDAGIGRTWIEAIASEFEKDFANYSFQEGRMGVQVIINHNRVDTGAVLLSGMSGSQDNVFFAEGVDYPSFANGIAYDVTDIMNAGAITGVDANGQFTREEVSIESKINPEFVNYLNRGTADNEKYVGFPYYLALKSILFDRDLWSEKKYFFAKEVGCPSELVATAIAADGDVTAAMGEYESELAKLQDDNKDNDDYWWFVDGEGKDVDGYEWGFSAGPDGVYDTYDDGMPATYEEFYLLMDKMVSDNITPFIWTGKFPGYADNITHSLFVNHEGKERLGVYYSLNGTLDNLVKFRDGVTMMFEEDGVTPQTESYTFYGGKKDGYNAQRMIGKYYALQFAEKVATTPAWTAKECYTGATSHITAQSTFLTSVTATDRNRIAMLSDGAWWQQESDQAFTIMATKNDKYSKYNRNIQMMMLPNANIERTVERAQNGIKNTMVASNDSFCLVNGNLAENSPQLAASKAFVSYIHNDKMLNIFSEKTNMYRGLNYDIDAETAEKMTPYGQGIVEYVKQSDIVYPYSNNELFIKNYQYLSNTHANYNWHAWVGSIEPTFPLTQLHDSENRKNGLNAKSYFEGLYHYYKDRVWEKLI